MQRTPDIKKQNADSIKAVDVMGVKLDMLTASVKEINIKLMRIAGDK